MNELRWLHLQQPADTLDGFDPMSKLLFASGRVAAIREMVRSRVGTL